MIHWKRGDPYPEDWPQWLRDADIEWCLVAISDDGRVIWHNGVWEAGVWHDGTWKDGIWRHGTWQAGTWESGIWRNGSWISGIWEDGLWQSGVWAHGLWLNGDWQGGTWYDGVWKTGIWHTGLWHNGTWEGGSQQVPRFGWEFRGDDVIGVLDGGFLILPRSEWEPLLKDMDPQKVLEYEMLVTWRDRSKALQKNRGEPGPSLWDHIEEES